MAKKDFIFHPYRKGDEHRLHWYDEQLVWLLSRSVSFWEKYFRYEVQGLNNIPATSGALLANNHGLWPFDAILLAKRLVDRGRPPRAMAEHATWKIPFIREVFLNMGVVDGTPKNAIRLLRNDDIVIVFPGGAREGLKSHRDRHRLFWQNRFGFVKVAIAAGKPIIPCFTAGIDYAYHVFADGYKMGKRLFNAYVPLPIFLGLGLMPFPVKLVHHIGEPIEIKTRRHAYRDDKVVQRIHQKVVEAAEDLRAEALATYRPWGL